MALKHYQDDQNGIRDYFTAKTAASILNTMRNKDSDHFFTAEEILKPFYPECVVTTQNDLFDPDMGAYIDDRATALLRGKSNG